MQEQENMVRFQTFKEDVIVIMEPGFTKEDVTISIDEKENELFLKLEHPELKDPLKDKINLSFAENQTFKFNKKFDVSKIEVKIENGILTIIAPTADHIKEIEVS